MIEGDFEISSGKIGLSWRSILNHAAGGGGGGGVWHNIGSGEQHQLRLLYNINWKVVLNILGFNLNF